jgi:hypothetical protein
MAFRRVDHRSDQSDKGGLTGVEERAWWSRRKDGSQMTSGFVFGLSGGTKMDQSFDLAMQGGIQGTREIRVILYAKDDPFLRAGAGGRAFDQGAAPEQGVTPTKWKI